jgi:hypothetical protein
MRIGSEKSTYCRLNSSLPRKRRVVRGAGSGCKPIVPLGGVALKSSCADLIRASTSLLRALEDMDGRDEPGQVENRGPISSFPGRKNSPDSPSEMRLHLARLLRFARHAPGHGVRSGKQSARAESPSDCATGSP